MVLSTVFWFSTMLKDDYEKEIEVPVRLVNVPKNAILINSIDDTIGVVVRDNGFTFLSYRYSDRIRPVNIDFNTYANKKTGKGVVPLDDLQKALGKMLYGSSHITSLKYKSLSFSFNFGQNKVLPVQLNGNIVPAQSFYISQVSFYPEKVTVYADKQVLDSMRGVFTERIDIRDFNDTIVRKVSLHSVAGAKVVPAYVTMKICPDVLIEGSIEVPVSAINMPNDKTLRLFPSKVKVVFVVGAGKFHSIKSSDFKVVADYNEIVEKPSDKCNIKIVGMPAEVSKAHLESSQVDYLIEQR